MLRRARRTLLGTEHLCNIDFGGERGYTNWRAACRKLMLILDRAGLRTLLLAHELSKFDVVPSGFGAELGSAHFKRAYVQRVFAITAPRGFCWAARGCLHNLKRRYHNAVHGVLSSTRNPLICKCLQAMHVDAAHVHDQSPQARTLQRPRSACA